MKNLGRYLFAVILVSIAFISGLDCVDYSTEESQNNQPSTEVTTCYIASSLSDSAPHLPRTTSYAKILRLPSAAKRTSNIQRNNFEFVKAGRIINTGITAVIQRESFNLQSSFVRGAQNVVSLGRLII